MRDTLAQALRHRGSLVMSGAYFVCGLNLVFLTTHLPAYLEICGQDPMLSAEALAVIGAVNCVGALLAGWLGGRGRSTSWWAGSISCGRLHSPATSWAPLRRPAR